jgi:hypothetical protein
MQRPEQKQKRHLHHLEHRRRRLLTLLPKWQHAEEEATFQQWGDEHNCWLNRTQKSQAGKFANSSLRFEAVPSLTSVAMFKILKDMLNVCLVFRRHSISTKFLALTVDQICGELGHGDNGLGQVEKMCRFQLMMLSNAWMPRVIRGARPRFKERSRQGRWAGKDIME